MLAPSSTDVPVLSLNQPSEKGPLLQFFPGEGEVVERLHVGLVREGIVSSGDWLGNPAAIKVENNRAVGYVGSSLTMHNPLFFVHKL